MTKDIQSNPEESIDKNQQTILSFLENTYLRIKANWLLYDIHETLDVSFLEIMEKGINVWLVEGGFAARDTEEEIRTKIIKTLEDKITLK